MLSDLDLYQAAHLMMHEYGHDAELEAASRANQMLARGDRDELARDASETSAERDQ